MQTLHLSACPTFIFGKTGPAVICTAMTNSRFRGTIMRICQGPLLLGLSGSIFLLPATAGAHEYYVGEPVVQDHLQIVPNYLTGIKMDRMPKGMDMSPTAIHLEVDVHATKGETHGFHEDEWIPYLTIHFTLKKEGTKFVKKGTLAAMTAGDGPHYANNVAVDGPGTYDLTYKILPPSSNGFIRHVDKATGVPEWWKPITAHWTFTYPSNEKS
jgi:periplasmic iron binding protein